MHRDSIEPGIVSDITTISPKGGSRPGASTDRFIGTVRNEIRQLWAIVNDLRSRVSKLESERARPVNLETDYAELMKRFDKRYLVKNGSAQNVLSNVTFAGPTTFTGNASFTGTVLVAGPFNLAYGWSIVCSSTEMWTYKNNNPAGQLS